LVLAVSRLRKGRPCTCWSTRRLVIRQSATRQILTSRFGEKSILALVAAHIIALGTWWRGPTLLAPFVRSPERSIESNLTAKRSGCPIAAIRVLSDCQSDIRLLRQSRDRTSFLRRPRIRVRSRLPSKYLLDARSLPNLK